MGASESPRNAIINTIAIRFQPGPRHTLAAVKVESGDGRTYHARPVWRGYIPIRLADLRGRTSAECAQLLCERLWDRLELDPSADIGDALAQEATALGREASAPLEGATGEALLEATLPGL